MSDIFRKQVLRERSKLGDFNMPVNEDWITKLIGSNAVRQIKDDAKRRVDAELSRRAIDVPPYPAEPQLSDLGLTDPALEYWELVLEAQRSEPELRWYKPVAIMKRLTKIKLRLPKQIRFVAGHVIFTPKLNRRDSFVAGLQNIVEAYERLSADDKAAFTTDGAPQMGGLRFPRPLAIAKVQQARAAYQKLAQAAAAVRFEVERQAWLDGLDRAAGQRTGAYKIGGRLGVEYERPDEQSK